MPMSSEKVKTGIDAGLQAGLNAGLRSGPRFFSSSSHVEDVPPTTSSLPTFSSSSSS